MTRPNRPGINVEAEPPAVKMNDALGGILTFKLKVLLSQLLRRKTQSSVAHGPCMACETVSAELTSPLSKQTTKAAQCVENPLRAHLLCTIETSACSCASTANGAVPQGEDVVRTSGVPFAVVRPVALTEEPAGADLQLDQGDTIKVELPVASCKFCARSAGCICVSLNP